MAKIYMGIFMKQLCKSCPISTYIRYKARDPRAGRVLYSVYVPYLGMIYVICVTRMQLMVAMYTDKRVVSHLDKCTS